MNTPARLAIVALALAACRSSEPAGESTGEPAPAVAESTPERSNPYPTPMAPLLFEADPGWVAEKPSSGMRLAQWTLPGEGADGDASLVIFFFGSGSGGSVEQNLERWEDQIEPADGGEAVRTTRGANGFTFHTVETSGRYVAAVFPGSDETHDEPGWRLVATVVEGGRGPFYAKLVGPAATVERWRASYDALLESMRP